MNIEYEESNEMENWIEELNKTVDRIYNTIVSDEERGKDFIRSQIESWDIEELESFMI